ncbi:hypothetical protein AT864_02398 [Anoxybacillus sp. P3H1B]|nr:hypothetical protein AT864_02398 [Anoxybacillus sp. P3H1B]MBB3907953.1 hypothetical protein [Anoxybacillus rupiensis]OQM47273.1 hypothetical protein B6A27_01610 [Anoxybacillus sp. UARK-01]
MSGFTTIPFWLLVLIVGIIILSILVSIYGIFKKVRFSILNIVSLILISVFLSIFPLYRTRGNELEFFISELFKGSWWAVVVLLLCLISIYWWYHFFKFLNKK